VGGGGGGQNKEPYLRGAEIGKGTGEGKTFTDPVPGQKEGGGPSYWQPRDIGNEKPSQREHILFERSKFDSPFLRRAKKGGHTSMETQSKRGGA